MQLNLRDLFWLIFVSAVATMWWIDRAKLAGRLEFYESPNFPADPFGPPQPAPPPLAPAPPADPFR